MLLRSSIKWAVINQNIFYRNFVFLETQGECYGACWAPSPLHCCSCWSSARSSGHPIAWVARGTQVPCLSSSPLHPLPLGSTGHLVRVQSPFPGSTQKGFVSQSNNDPKQELQRFNRTRNTRSEGGRRKKLQWNKLNRSFSAAHRAPSKCQQFQKSCNL